jgi:2-dehydro-3-deoxyphosphooctonate aldolase (KDO 8-P synthase)
VTVPELFAGRDRFFLIAGPCVLEDDDLNLRIASDLAAMSQELGIPVIFKASFDKANRSSPNSPRGPGLDEGLERLAKVRRETGLPLLTDVHEAAQCRAAADAVDVLQIPAFLCRQTDLLIAASETGRPVNIKKGQWMAPEEMAGAVAKSERAGAAGVAVTERGTFFGYGNLVVDMRTFPRLKNVCRGPVVFDGTHSVQRPGEGAGVSGGDPEMIPTLVSAAIAAGADALFLEVHPEPSKAPSDSTNMLRIEKLRPLMRRVLAIREAIGSDAP